MTCDCTQLANLLRWYYLPTMYSLEFCLGLLGNLLVILGYLFCLKGWKSSNVYLFNLAVSDLLFLCTLPRLANCYARDSPEVSPGFCIANRLLLHVNLYSSILFMAWVSADRYLLVRHPLRQHPLLRRGVAVAVSALTWVAVCVQVAPLLVFIVRDMERSNWTRCSDFGSLSAGGDGGRHLAYSLALTATGYLLPLLALCLSSARIAAVLKAQAGLFQNRADGFRRPQRMVLATAAMFLVLYAPYHVMRNVHIAHQAAAAASNHTCDRCVESAYIVTRPIAFAHSVVNPAFYFFMGDHFREQLIDRVKALFRGRGSQQNQSQGRESTAPVV
ncbi:succinate receptor 1-like [Anguilla rostrata]|uniref:succinate receptor 1-like n=1 Tax=Anguilla rostrata TaxID=7938 RepID=UPI0030CFA031